MMYTQLGTTSFGRRSMTLALVKNEMSVTVPAREKSVEKWTVYRNACEARVALGLKDRALAVLRALISFYPDDSLTGDSNLVVFPSNAQLASRANGIASTTLRENLAILVNAGLIHRRDSPNGKRYARRSRSGSIESAFGFSLAPLLSRSEELADMAQRVANDMREFKLVKEDVSLCRRDIRKLISAAMLDNVAGDWIALEGRYAALVGTIAKARTPQALNEIHHKLAELRQDVINSLEEHIFSEKSDGNDAPYRHHIQNSQTESLKEFEAGSEKPQTSLDTIDQKEKHALKAFPLDMVLRACPQMKLYAPNGTIHTWRDLMSTATVVASMLGISPAAYRAACNIMGPEITGSAISCILERADAINSAGAYLRNLTARAEKGTFSLGPMLLALMRAQPDGALTPA